MFCLPKRMEMLDTKKTLYFICHTKLQPLWRDLERGADNQGVQDAASLYRGEREARRL